MQTLSEMKQFGLLDALAPLLQEEIFPQHSNDLGKDAKVKISEAKIYPNWTKDLSLETIGVPVWGIGTDGEPEYSRLILSQWTSNTLSLRPENLSIRPCTTTRIPVDIQCNQIDFFMRYWCETAKVVTKIPRIPQNDVKTVDQPSAPPNIAGALIRVLKKNYGRNRIA